MQVKNSSCPFHEEVLLLLYSSRLTPRILVLERYTNSLFSLTQNL